MQYTILICDDDEDILAALAIYLNNEGYNVIKASNGKQAVDAVLSEQSFHLVLLDVMMPVMDGIRAAVKIREATHMNSNVPIIFLSAKSEDTDRVLGLNMGGDDYVTKPFNPVELIARIKASLRRYSQFGGMLREIEEDTYTSGEIFLDNVKKIVIVNGNEVTLTPIEFNILKLLISNPDRVFSSTQIYEKVWDEPAFDVARTVSVHIRRIRSKIELNPKEPQYIKMVYGLGYKVVKL
ncbi:MAG: response regulator transcription factor [Oscillospiraceae bacterium]|nr:response regulator transcription factor [Oscillospiraceae bacterium]